MRLAGTILIGLGVALFLVGMIFWLLNWPDMFQGRFSGIVLFFLGVISRSFKKSGKKSNQAKT